MNTGNYKAIYTLGFLIKDFICFKDKIFTHAYGNLEIWNMSGEKVITKVYEKKYILDIKLIGGSLMILTKDNMIKVNPNTYESEKVYDLLGVYLSVVVDDLLYINSGYTYINMYSDKMTEIGKHTNKIVNMIPYGTGRIKRMISYDEKGEIKIWLKEKCEITIYDTFKHIVVTGSGKIVTVDKMGKFNLWN